MAFTEIDIKRMRNATVPLSGEEEIPVRQGKKLVKVALDKLKALLSPDVVVTGRDVAGNITTYTLNGVTWTVAYNGAGNIATETGSNGVLKTYNYDGSNRFTSITVGSV